MGLVAQLAETLAPARRPPEHVPASPEEGRRLIALFLQVERPELREEIVSFVERTLGRQDRG